MAQGKIGYRTGKELHEDGNEHFIGHPVRLACQDPVLRARDGLSGGLRAAAHPLRAGSTAITSVGTWMEANRATRSLIHHRTDCIRLAQKIDQLLIQIIRLA